MNQENYQFLTDSVLRNLGFNEQGIFDALKAKMEKGGDLISLVVKNQNKVEFEFKLEKDESTERYYLNTVRGTLPEKDGKSVSQEFKLFFQRGFNEVEMENLLNGRSVYTNIQKSGEKLQFWTRLDFMSKNDSDNYPERRLYDNRTNFSLAREISQIPQLRQLNQDEKEQLIRGLQRGSQVPIRVNYKNSKETLFFEAAPLDGKIRIYNDKGVELQLKEEKPKMEVVPEKKLPENVKNMMTHGDKGQGKGQGVRNAG